MEETLKQILEGQNKIFQEVLGIKGDISRLESKVDKIANEGENDIVSVINLMNNKIDHLSTKEDIIKLNSKFEVLNSRLFHQEVELYELKAVK